MSAYYRGLRAACLAIPAAAALTSHCSGAPLPLSLPGDYAPPPPALSPADFRPLRVAKTEALSHNTRRLTLELPREGDDAGLVAASCVVLRLDVDGKPVVRPYTPVSRPRARGSIDLVVKAYPTGLGKCVGCAAPAARYFFFLHHTHTQTRTYIHTHTIPTHNPSAGPSRS